MTKIKSDAEGHCAQTPLSAILSPKPWSTLKDILRTVIEHTEIGFYTNDQASPPPMFQIDSRAVFLKSERKYWQ